MLILLLIYGHNVCIKNILATSTISEKSANVICGVPKCRGIIFAGRVGDLFGCLTDEMSK